MFLFENYLENLLSFFSVLFLIRGNNSNLFLFFLFSWGVNAFMLNVVQSLLAILIIAACLLISLGIAIYYLFAREKVT